MSDVTKNLIQRYYDAFNRTDWDAMLACLAPDVAHDVNQSMREVGLAPFAAFLQRMEQSYSEQLRNVVIMVNGDRGAAEFVVHGRYLRTDVGLPDARGQNYILPGGAFFEVRHGQIARISNYYNLNDWLQQVAA